MQRIIVIVICMLPWIVVSQKIKGIRLDIETGEFALLVQVDSDPIWHPVCYTIEGENVVAWNNQAAWVACRQEGFYGGRADAYMGVSGTGPKLYNVSCEDGLFDDLNRCTFRFESDEACLNGKGAAVQCYEAEFEFRIDYNDKLAGRIEVLHDDTWLPVCYKGGHDDQQWTSQEAWVTCRQNGYHGGRSISYDLNYQGLVVNDVRCGTGFYDDLNACFFEVESVSCTRQAGVECFDLLDIHLVHELSFEATPGLTEGRVEMSYQGQWIPVCHYGGMAGEDYSWSNQAAWVTCRQLGFYGGRRRRYQDLSVTNELTVNDVRCRNGLFHHLQECVFELEETACSRNEQAGVECFDTILPIRLLSENNVPTMTGPNGKLEMLYKDKWLPVCYDTMMSNDHSWNNQAAWVACRQLGYYGGSSTAHMGVSTNSSLNVMDARCGNGLLHTLQDCFFEVEEGDCLQQAGVQCFETPWKVRLRHNETDHTGGVQVFLEGEWITVCDRSKTSNFWNSQAAWVVCRHLGFHGGVKSTMDIAVSSSFVSIECGDGLYSSIHECFIEVHEDECTEPAALECYNDPISNIRLTDNATVEGRLEAFYVKEWVAVCYDGGPYDDIWNDEAAAVTCRQLGFDNGKASVYQNVSGSSRIIKDVRCGDGLYDNFQKCSFEVGRCESGTQAGVNCFDKDPTFTPTASHEDAFPTATENLTDGSKQNAANVAVVGGVTGGVFLCIFVIFVVMLLLYKYKYKEKSNASSRSSSNLAIISNPDHLNDALHTNPAYETSGSNTNNYQEEETSGYTYVDTNRNNHLRNQNHNENEYDYAVTHEANNAQPNHNDNDYAYAETPHSNLSAGRSSYPHTQQGNHGEYAYVETPKQTPTPPANRNSSDVYAYAETLGGFRPTEAADGKDTDPAADFANAGWMENTLYSTSGGNNDA